MTTLTISQTHDYRNEALTGTTLIDFTNAVLTSVTASFTAGQITTLLSANGGTLALDGSGGTNRLNIYVAGETRLDALVITNWSANDRITLLGDSTDNDMTGSDVNDVMFGSGGMDHLWSRGGVDQMYGGTERDVIHLDDGFDDGRNGEVADGGEGEDDLYLGRGASTVDLVVDLMRGPGVFRHRRWHEGGEFRGGVYPDGQWQ